MRWLNRQRERDNEKETESDIKRERKKEKGKALRAVVAKDVNIYRYIDIVSEREIQTEGQSEIKRCCYNAFATDSIMLSVMMMLRAS